MLFSCRRLLGVWIALCVLVAAPSFGQTGKADATRFDLTILHTNDLHGHIFPFAYTELGKNINEQASIGGAARRATLVRQLRKDAKNSVVLVDGGDTFTRGPLTNAYEGIADVEAMNAVGYELAVIGNNEFKAKDGFEASDAKGAQAALLQVVKRARFPWLSANTVDEKGASLEGVFPFVVRRWNGVRVGFLGLTAPRVASYPQAKGWTIRDPIAAAKEWIPRARAQCDVLIAVTHLGVDLDKQLAAQTTGIDAIVGGDSHTFLYKAVEVTNPDGVRVPIVQDGEFGVNLGRFDLHFSKNASGTWSLARYEYVLLPVGPTIAEARDVQAELAPYLAPYLNVVGHASAIGTNPAERMRLTTSTVMDALRAETRADLALNPVGEGMFEVFRQPNVTRYEVYAALPFNNHVATADLTGAEIQALAKAKPTTVVSGIALDKLDAAKTYRVAFVDFVATGAYQLPIARLTDTGRDMRVVVIEYLGKQK